MKPKEIAKRTVVGGFFGALAGLCLSAAAVESNNSTSLTNSGEATIVHFHSHKLESNVEDLLKIVGFAGGAAVGAAAGIGLSIQDSEPQPNNQETAQSNS